MFVTRLIPTHQLAIVLLVLTAGMFTAEPGFGVASGDESSRAESSDKDYAAGKRAYEAEDWQGVIDSMQKVVDRRPWHDNALSYMGYAHRKLGNYEQALSHYNRALERNPRNRGALEYLGEAYLDLGQPEKAKEMLDRLEAECKRIAIGFTNGGWKSGCEEWEQLLKAYTAYQEKSQAGR